ncbi:multiple epidermal growth factor-like domains protein 10 [Haliotis rufescens]|uniref:multiple epidermal growth factor-like domains protein 10 n=1 Tax=Haliotis rufescens TaxID=6454 RepID=UPI00201F5786|nr:multiple epidermal growth factor-like domains protein 10 [Haliotis rufescens]
MMDFCEVEVNECEHGRYGHNCPTDCRLRECKGDSSRCDQGTGECIEGCRGGYRGPDCMRPCEEGHYGANCSRKCDDRHCKHPDASCNHVTGECVHNCRNPGTGGVKNQACRPGWQGLDCVADCSSGTFGDKCSGSCGACLDSELCHRVNGTCPRGCSDGWSGHLCKQKCIWMTYGANCSETCDACLDNDTCHHGNGRCLRGCKEGLTGEFCTLNQKSDGGGLSPVVSGILDAVTMLVAVAAIGGVWCLWRRHIIREQSMNSAGPIVTTSVTSNDSENNYISLHRTQTELYEIIRPTVQYNSEGVDI